MIYSAEPTVGERRCLVWYGISWACWEAEAEPWRAGSGQILAGASPGWAKPAPEDRSAREDLAARACGRVMLQVTFLDVRPATNYAGGDTFPGAAGNAALSEIERIIPILRLEPGARDQWAYLPGALLRLLRTTAVAALRNHAHPTHGP